MAAVELEASQGKKSKGGKPRSPRGLVHVLPRRLKSSPPQIPSSQTKESAAWRTGPGTAVTSLHAGGTGTGHGDKG
ncbi:unnamed protein product [Lota lota]